jgi:hypothetical protein
MTDPRRRLANLALLAGVAGLVFALVLAEAGGVAVAAPSSATAPGLGAAASYSALGKAGVTNTGNSVLSGNVGADSSITGFPPGMAQAAILAPAVNQAEADASTADLALTSQAGSATPVGSNLTGVTLVPGIYSLGAALLPGQLTLNGSGVYVFLIASSLTASGSVNLINGAAPCNVFWHVTSSASLTGGSFVGTIIAGASVTIGNGVSLQGRALALTGNVTLINDSISGPSCAGAPGPSPTPTITVTPGGPTVTPLPTVQPTASAPSYVDVQFDCAVNGLGAVRVGLSAGVIVYGLGDDITSATDTGLNKIVRMLPVGHYAWHAIPPAGHYMQNTSTGVVDIVTCVAATAQATAGAGGTAAPTTSGPVATTAPGATALATAATAATAVPVLLPQTGADLAAGRALASRQAMQFGVGFLGLGLVLLGLRFRRTHTQ